MFTIVSLLQEVKQLAAGSGFSLRLDNAEGTAWIDQVQLCEVP